MKEQVADKSDVLQDMVEEMRLMRETANRRTLGVQASSPHKQ